MRIYRFLPLIFALSLSGCAEIASVNKSVANVAGTISEFFGLTEFKFEDSATSNRDIDTLYVRIKREFSFDTRNEALAKNPSVPEWLREKVLTENGFAHETTPGSYYHMADQYTFGHLSVVLEKEGKGTVVNWSVKTTDKSVGPTIKKRILKAIK